jgi:CUB/sushi domain-containing protein
MSGRYTEFQKRYQNQRYVFMEKTRVCNRGSVRYEREKASKRSEFRLSDGFAAAVRALPKSYDSFRYSRFLDEWGTHVVTEVRVGSKYIEQFYSSFQEAYTYALNQYSLSTSASASFLTISGSVSLNVDRLVQSSSFLSSRTSTRKVTTMGSSIYWDTVNNKWVTPLNTQLTEPISVSVVQIDEFLSSAYTTDQSVLSRKSGLSRALANYPSYRGSRSSTDYSLAIPIVWPRGTYGLVKPINGCPSASWNSGYRYHDTEDGPYANNHWSGRFDLAGKKWRNNMIWEFCMKLFDDKVNYVWPKGQYCILKKYSCPSGFHYGAIYWDDADHGNENSAGGTLPDGSYDINTRIDFCCRKDGDPARAILLPTSRQFILVSATDRCQKVHGMSVSLQWFYWDNEDTNNADFKSGMPPYETGGSRNHKLYFCYYYK